jgi:hypothetical protein
MPHLKNRTKAVIKSSFNLSDVRNYGSSRQNKVILALFKLRKTVKYYPNVH